jgi:hypothetical protein
MGKKKFGSKKQKTAVVMPIITALQKDFEKFAKFLQPFWLKLVEVEKDGNCLYRAVSDQLFGT